MSDKFLLENVANKIEMNFMGYHVEGVAVLKNWGGDIGYIKMKPFYIDASNLKNEDELNEVIKSLMNDNGFGCESILGAWIVLYAKYMHDEACAGTKIYLKEFYLNKSDYKTPEKFIQFAEDVWMESM